MKNFVIDNRASRRQFLWQGIAVASSVALASNSFAANLSGPKLNGDVTIENFSADGKSQGSIRISKLVKTEAEWRSQLSPLAYKVTREEGTEAPGSGKYANNHADGIYRCICCETALFDSKTKFESGTGWPSFWKPISAMNVVKISDRTHGMVRDAISCRRCDAHLGHVFDDGPKPTGLRYCMNSVSLNFIARS
ncbi:MAG: peptide-methionine (R)-S-oxide reductase [Gammaproteobacteria bacterium]|nr:MAG: peptide-methionine (R)-S-oxide reductase [Gammaproteobacteria bacterium]